MIETERLMLVPLDAEQMKLLVKDTPAFEKMLECVYAGENPDEAFCQTWAQQIGIAELDPQKEGWHSTWAILEKQNREMAGMICFRNLPDENWITEVGFGLGEGARRRGLMTEALNAVCEWALSQPKVARIVAETDPDNFPAETVLKACGFYAYARARTNWWIRLTNKEKSF